MHQPSWDAVRAAALVLRRLRECDAPLEDDGNPPCPFCEWDWHPTNQSETGCMFVARQMLRAAHEADAKNPDRAGRSG